MMKTRIKKSVLNREGKLQVFVVDEYDDHIVLDAYLSEEFSEVDIPSKITEKPVTSIGDDCFFGHKEITAVTFPDTLKTIGSQAFGMCEGIKELILPDSVTEIESYAFRDCTGLQRIVLPAGLKTLKSGTFAFCYLHDDVEIKLNEGLETIESRVFSSGGVNHFFKVRLPNSVKEVADGAFDPGVIIEPAFPYSGRWFVPLGTTCIKEMISGHILHDNIIRTYGAQKAWEANFTRGVLTKDELRQKFTEQLHQGFFQFLSEKNIWFEFNKGNWISFKEDYKQWLQGLALKNRDDIPWLRLSRTRNEMAIWEQSNLGNLPEWTKYYVELCGKDKASFFELMDAFGLPVEYFEPAPDDVVFDERKPAGPPLGAYGGGYSLVIDSKWSDNGDLLHDPSPVGKFFTIVSDLELKATVKITEQTDWYGKIVFIGDGTIEGYTTNRIRPIEIYVGKEGTITSVKYLEYPEDAEYYSEFPLWQKAIAYTKYKQRILDKTLEKLILRFDYYHKMRQGDKD